VRINSAMDFIHLCPFHRKRCYITLNFCSIEDPDPCRTPSRPGLQDTADATLSPRSIAAKAKPVRRELPSCNPLLRSDAVSRAALSPFCAHRRKLTPLLFFSRAQVPHVSLGEAAPLQRSFRIVVTLATGRSAAFRRA
jgi:hypothetical protein